MPFGSSESFEMSGDRYLLDTNAVVALLRGEHSLRQRLEEAAWVGISVLSEIEFLAFPDISAHDRQSLQEFAERVDVIGLDHSSQPLIDRIVRLRQQHKLKLPDAIIAATALEAEATLITDDAQLRKLSAVISIGIR
jgi:tRNA(fMet)-specific endonuclease VapC